MAPELIHEVPEYSWRVDFSDAYKAVGSPSVLSISQATKLSRTTITPMIQDGGVQVTYLSNAIPLLALYFKVDWRDCVEAVVVKGNIEALTEGELKTA